MALIPCPDCGTEISDQAPACPKCGRPRTAAKPTKPVSYTPTAIVLTLAAALLALYVSMTPAKLEEAGLFIRWVKRMLGMG